jgi:3-oxoacyl-[acyl-carrier protein] reductase
MTDLALLAGKAAVVTGGSRGIGRAIVVALASEGANVAFSYRRDARAARETVAAVERLGRRAIAVPSDAADPTQPEAFVGRARAELGRIDLVVASAGVPGPPGWEAVPSEGWNEVFATHVVGPFALVRAARAHLPPSGGSVVIVSSIAGISAMPSEAAYAASKAAAISLTRTLALAMAPAVRVNAVLPGWVRTDMTRELHETTRTREAILRTIPRGRWGEPDDVAAAVLFLASDGARFVTGEALVVDGGGSVRWRAGVEP